ncbi:MAG: hypothetical protein WCF85_08975 [Rhodospirillaceae bacterium]
MDKIPPPRHGVTMSIAEVEAATRLLMYLVGALMIGIGATMSLRAMMPPMLGRLFQVAEVERKYLDKLRDGYLVRNRVRALQAEETKLEEERLRMEGELRKLLKEMESTGPRIPDFIHEVGEPRPGLKRYLARLSVDSSSPFIRLSSEIYNPIWHHINVAEIWASSREEAKQLLELAYSEKLGFQKVLADSANFQSESTVR